MSMSSTRSLRVLFDGPSSDRPGDPWDRRARAGFKLAKSITAVVYVFLPGGHDVLLGRRIMKDLPSVSGRTILGLLSVYLLMGMTFAGLFTSIAVISDEPFFAETKTAEPVEFTYFSVVTLWSIGYRGLHRREPDASDALGHRGLFRSAVSGRGRCGCGVQVPSEEESTARGLTLRFPRASISSVLG